MARILIADDKKGMREVLAQALEGAGHRVEVVSDGNLAIRALDRGFEVVVTDLRMPEKDGLAVLAAAMERRDPPEVLVMTAFGSVDAAVEAMRLGAFDFVQKPFGLAEMEAKIEKALAGRSMKVENTRLREADRSRAGRLVGDGAAMNAVRASIAKVAPTAIPVLVTGGSGTGKELVAREIHDRSPRAGGPFVPVNCAALAEGVLESELFGHEKGSFTGASGLRRGKLELASAGTLFLDEVGEIPLSIQVKLLRFLQEKEIERVGGDERIKVDARVVAATNRDLEAEIKTGRFREDFFYRLNVLRIHMPPLSERLEDLPALVDTILGRVSTEIGRKVAISPEARARLPEWRWPGNVRELENVLARAAVLSDDGTIRPDDLRLQSGSGGGTDPAVFVDAPGMALEARVDAFEKSLIAQALTSENGNQSRAAEKLGVKRSTLQYKMTKHGFGGKSEGDAEGT